MADFPTIDNPITTDNIEPNTPGYIDPRLDVDVENIKDCKYRYSFKMIKGSKNISKYTLNFTLPAEFSDATENFTPINGNPLPKLTKVSTNPTTNAVTYCWELNGPKEPFKFSESSFVVDYTGDINKPFFTENVVNWTAEFVFPGGSKDGSKYYTETTKKNCQVLPCCEECNGDTLKTVTLSPCDDQAVVNYNPSVVLQPRGRKISVNLNLPAVCDKKDVVVGVYLNEVTAAGEVPYAHKVILRPAGTSQTGICRDDRDCNCVDFFVYDTQVCPTTRVFKVRTKAHQLDTNLSVDDDNQCHCSCTMADN